MNTLNTPIPLRVSRMLAHSYKGVIYGMCLLVSLAHAQADKQISYPVAIPVERPVAQAVAVPTTPTAPEPVIRPISEAADAPPPVKRSTRKAASNKAVSAEDEPAPKKAVTKKAASKKVDVKTEAKKTTSRTAGATKKSAPPPAQSAPANPVSKPVAASGSAEKKTAENLAPESTAPNVIMAAAAAAPVALANPAATEDDGEGIDATLPEEEQALSPEAPEPAAAAKAIAPAPNLPLALSGQQEAFVTEFQKYVETKIVPKVPGLALAVIADGKVKVLQGYGLRKYGSRDPVNTDTLFRLASVSKSFASSAAAMLVRDKLITWDTPIRSILPDVEFSNPRYGDELTIRHILSQSTGLPTQANTNFIEEGMPFEEVVRRLRYVNFICPPGKCYNYQNVTYSLISDVIAKKTGKTYEQYVNEHIFKPLGMRTATLGLAGLKASGNYAAPHVPARKGWYAAEVTENYYRVNPAAGVNASIADMSRWVLAHMGHNPDVLSPAILGAVHAKVTRNTPAQNHYGSREGVTDSHYGLGWRVFDYRGDKNFIHHGGGVMGFRSEVVFNPDLQIGMVVLTNTQRLAGDIIFEFLDAYEDEKRGESRNIVTKALPKKPVFNKKK